MPGWPEVRFYFTAHPTTFASEFGRILRAGEPYCVLRLARDPERFVPRFTAAHWAFHVYPVRRVLKSVARAAFCSGALAAFRDFLAHSPTHAHYYNRCDAVFDPVEGTCTTQVFHPL
jgi:hypothetical protein